MLHISQGGSAVLGVGSHWHAQGHVHADALLAPWEVGMLHIRQGGFETAVLGVWVVMRGGKLKLVFPPPPAHAHAALRGTSAPGPPTPMKPCMAA